MEPPSGQTIQPAPAGFQDLLRIARQAVMAKFGGRNQPPTPTAESPLAKPCPVFVTIRDQTEQLRGCIGTLQARFSTVAEETWHMAHEAAFSDPRFRPVGRDELPGLTFEVSVLHPLEPVTELTELDADRYGIVITTDDGRRAALLPGIDGVDTVAHQLAITRRKGGIGPSEPIRIQRFQVDKVRESDPADRAESSANRHGPVT